MVRPERTRGGEAESPAAAGRVIPLPGGAVERARVFSSLHSRIFGSSEPVRVGRFRVLERLGAGAMGVVYAAHDPDLDRKIALKILQGASADPEIAARADREARSLARLRHPNVVTVHEVGSHAGDRFIAMDLVEGSTLREWMAGAHDWRAVLDVFVQAARGLGAAHAAGLVHRDFKPDNVLVEAGHVRVADFGFARPPATLVIGDDLDASEAFDSIDEITQAGTVAGTPAYMAPEAFRGEVDAKSDQFAFCASLYEALYGARPFVGETVSDLLAAIRRGIPAPPVVRRRVPAWLRRAILRGLADDPQRRWPSMQAWSKAVEARRGRPRRTAIFAALGGIVLGAAAVLASSPSAEAPCARVGETIASTWNAERRDAVERAFEATKLAYARESWIRVDTTLEAWAQAWSRMREDACAATHVRHEQSDELLDLRMRCMDRHRGEYDALVTAFESADAEVVPRAVSAARALPPLDDCADLDALSRDGSTIADAVPDEMHARLAGARAATATGRYTAALPDAQQLARDAEDAGHLELAGRAHLAVATLQDRAADYAAAEASTKTAIALADRAGDDSTRASAQTFLVSLLAQQRQLPRAHDWAELARASVQRLGNPPRLVATLAASHGNALYADGRYEEALARRREALALRETFLDEDDPQLADSHYGLGTVLQDLGHRQEARAELELALEIRRRALGEHHPLVARAHVGLANTLVDNGELNAGIDHLHRAIDIGSIALGPDHRFVGEAYANLGTATAQGSDPRASEPHFRRAIEIFDSIDPQGLAVATATLNLARVLLFTDRLAEGVDLLRRTQGIYEAVLGPDHPDNMYVLNNIATAQRKVGHPREALETARRALEIGRTSLGEEHELVADAWLRTGEVERDLGHGDAAIAAFSRALEIHARIQTRPAQRAEVHLALARAYVDAGRRHEARREIGLARAGFEGDPVDHENWLTEIDELDAQLEGDGPPAR